MNRIIPRRSLLASTLLLVLFCTHHLHAQNPDAWDRRFSLPGIVGTVYDVHVDDDGNTYFTGELYGAENRILRSPVVRWNGSEWQSLHDGAEIRVGDVRVAIESRLSTALAGNDVIAIGRSLGSGNTHYVMRLRNGKWEPVGDAFDRVPRTVVAAGDMIYVGGDFKRIGTDTIVALARWDGSAWRRVSSEIEGSVSDLFIDERGHLLVAGSFTARSAVNTARWDGTTWHTLAADTLDQVTGIATAGGTVYAIGDDTLYRASASGFEQIIPADRPNATFRSLLAVDSLGRLYVAATPFARQAPGMIYRVNGEDISLLSDAFDGPVRGMAISPDGAVYVGGEFTNVGGRPLLGAAVATSAGWEAPGSGGHSYHGLIGKPSRAAFLNDTEFAVAGKDLTTTVLRTPQRLLHWTGTSWRGIDPPYRGVITDLEETSSGIVAAFNESDLPTPRSIIAQWSGAVWQPVGNPLPYNINDVFVRGSEILAVGSFNNVGTVLRWNGRTWDLITDNVRGIVHCGVIRDNGEIIIGGEFDSVGFVPAGNIALWRQGSWRAIGNVRYVKQLVVGPKTEAAVYAIEIDRNRLYVGGQFDRIDTVLSTNIAFHDGTSWHSMDSGLSGRFQIGGVLMEYPAKVTSIISSGADVIVGGEFRVAGSTNTRVRTDNAVVVGNLTVFDTTTEIWSEAGGNVQGWQYNRVNDLTVRNGSLLVAGTFFRAGNSPSHNVALNTDLSKRLNVEVAERDLRFDATPVHRESVKQLTISNPASSTRTLSITIEIVSGPYRAQQHAIRLGPGETRGVPITFAPTATGAAYGLARIHHNAAAHDGTPPIDVSLFGNGVPLDVYVDVDPHPVDFGMIVAGDRPTLPVVIANRAGSNGSLSYTIDTSGASPFSFVRMDESDITLSPRTLSPGESDTLLVSIRTSAIGHAESSVRIAHDATLTTTVLSLPLRAEIIEKPEPYSVEPRRLDFGQRFVDDDPDTLALVVGNPDPRPGLLNYEIGGLNMPFRLAATSRGTGSIGAGKSDTILVEFAPERSQAYGDTVVVRMVSERGSFEERIPVFGTAYGYAGMIVTPLEIDFGMVAVGQEAERWIEIVVPDTALLDLALAADAPTDPFIVGSIPGRMAPGTTHRIPVRFAPSVPGTFNDVLLIEHNVVHLSNPLPISVRGDAQFVDDVPRATSGGDVMLSVPRPNPATDHTDLTIALSKPIHVQLIVVDAAGRVIGELVDDLLNEGTHRLKWNTRGVAEGTYVLRLDAENVRQVRTVVVTR